MTAQASSRRSLRFDSIDQALAEVAALVEAEAGGRLRQHGRWTLGQILNHLATWVDFTYDGFPFRIPALVRCLLRSMKRRMLAGPLVAGVRLPGVRGGTLGTAVVPTAEASSHCRAAFGRLATEAPSRPHPIFGPMGHEEWVALHLRHAELHLSFLAPE